MEPDVKMIVEAHVSLIATAVVQSIVRTVVDTMWTLCRPISTMRAEVFFALLHSLRTFMEKGWKYETEESADFVVVGSGGCGDFSLEPTGNTDGEDAGRHDAGSYGER